MQHRWCTATSHVTIAPAPVARWRSAHMDSMYRKKLRGAHYPLLRILGLFAVEETRTCANQGCSSVDEIGAIRVRASLEQHCQCVVDAAKRGFSECRCPLIVFDVDDSACFEEELDGAHVCLGSACVSPLSSISSRDSETKPHFWQICRAVRRVWPREEQTQSVYTLRSRNLHVFQLLCCLLTHVTLDVRTIQVNQCECL